MQGTARIIKVSLYKYNPLEYDYEYKLEDSNDLDKHDKYSYQSPSLNKENSWPKTNEEAQLPKKISRKQKSRK